MLLNALDSIIIRWIPPLAYGIFSLPEEISPLSSIMSIVVMRYVQLVGRGGEFG